YSDPHRLPPRRSSDLEIDDVAEELARSGAMLNERLEAESRLASDASHQLRTPLTALSMRLDEILAHPFLRAGGMGARRGPPLPGSEEHTSELHSPFDL